MQVNDLDGGVKVDYDSTVNMTWGWELFFDGCVQLLRRREMLKKFEVLENFKLESSGTYAHTLYA